MTERPSTGSGLDGGDAILEALRNLDVDYIISSPGSEWPSVWEALARQKLEERPGPTYINCWHETLAVAMASGYTRMTGRMQAVLLHAGVGVLQGSMGIHGAYQGEVPMLVCSGESATYGEAPEFDPGPQWLRNLSIVGGPKPAGWSRSPSGAVVSPARRRCTKRWLAPENWPSAHPKAQPSSMSPLRRCWRSGRRRTA